MAFAVHSVCLRCGPHIKACERARGGKKCPVPKMYASGRTTYDALVEVWYEKLRRQRAANFPTQLFKKVSKTGVEGNSNFLKKFNKMSFL
jgi:hypothetical protein